MSPRAIRKRPMNTGPGPDGAGFSVDMPKTHAETSRTRRIAIRIRPNTSGPVGDFTCIVGSPVIFLHA
jgi:hypothetical protein